MPYPIVVEPLAKRDIREARDWLENAKPGLGDRFRIELEATLNRIAANPTGSLASIDVRGQLHFLRRKSACHRSPSRLSRSRRVETAKQLVVSGGTHDSARLSHQGQSPHRDNRRLRYERRREAGGEPARRCTHDSTAHTSAGECVYWRRPLVP